MGDFNFPDILWDSSSHVDYRISVFINCFLDYFLTQVVNEPIWNTALLDLILTNNKSLVDEVWVEENLGISGHKNNIIRFNMSVTFWPKLQINQERTFDFQNGDFTKFAWGGWLYNLLSPCVFFQSLYFVMFLIFFLVINI